VDDAFCGSRGSRLRGVTYLLTFRPFAKLPSAVQKAYLAGELQSIAVSRQSVFSGVCRRIFGCTASCPSPCRFRSCTRCRGTKIRAAFACRNRAGCTSRGRISRSPIITTGRYATLTSALIAGPASAGHEDELCCPARIDSRMCSFSTSPEDVGLYGKPMARNAQLWTHEFRRLLDGPSAAPTNLRRAAHALADGGLFATACCSRPCASAGTKCTGTVCSRAFSRRRAGSRR